nr:CHASE2 domain-containing protein [Desulfobacula sp.]
MLILITVLLITLAVGSGSYSNHSFFRKLDHFFYDQFMKTFAAKEISDNITIIDIDETSLSAIGQWPWPRYRLANLVKTIHEMQPRAMGLDIFLPEPDRTSLKNIKKLFQTDFDLNIGFTGVPSSLNDNDGYLGHILKKSEVVGARYFYFDHFNKKEDCKFKPFNILDRSGLLSLNKATGVLCNTFQIENSLEFIGFTNNQYDEDGILRKALLLLEFKGDIYTSLSFSTFLKAHRINQAQILNNYYGLYIKAGKYNIPITKDGFVRIRFNGPSRAHNFISALDIFNNNYSPSDIQDKIILIGSSAVGLNDIHHTIYDPQFPGVEIQAVIIDNILKSQQIIQPIWEKIFIFGGCMVTGIFMAFLFFHSSGPTSLFLGTIAWICILFILSIVSYMKLLIFISPGLPGLIAICLFSFFSFVRFSFARRASVRWLKELEASKKALQKAMKNLQTAQVTNGVYWIQIPEAGLNILCGCPGEVVKHLMIKGYIATVCQGDTFFETGPNAILLSDVLIQNGGFSNLSEFPVLQMLYRQGFIIPNHPNNTGEKPILIGSREQVNSQKQYIFRGNFGLATKQEILETGISQALADEMMRWKNKFRFGIEPSIEDLIDSVIVEKEPVEIKNKVFVRRNGLNIYEFSYKGRTTQINLNLDSNDPYTSPYSLGYHKIKREDFAVIHSGEGDGWNTSKPSMGSILTFQGGIYLIDAPPNIIYILRSLGIDISEIIGIFHTHAHDDHFASLPFLLQSDHRIKYFATPLVRASVSKKFSALLSLDEATLSRFFDFHDLDFNQWNNCDGLEVKPIFSPHPVETNIFIFRALGNAGYKTYAHYADIISLDLLYEMVGDDPNSISLDTYNHIKEAYLIPSTLKKIDIGGGMIHGQAMDFKHDTSEKIILAHTEKELTDEQKEIGSESSFGQCDVLIPGSRDYLKSYAAQYFESFFPFLDTTDFNMLLNTPVIDFNPGSMILKKGNFPAHLYLVLTGTVEYIDSGSGIKNNLSNGSFIGEFNLFQARPSPGVYRTLSHVATLCFSFDFFRSFLEKNHISELTKKMFERIDFLKSTWLFGEESSYAVQYKIAQTMKAMELDENCLVFEQQFSGLYLIKSGEIQVRDHEDFLLETLKSGAFFGENHFFEPEKTGLHFVTSEPSQLYAVNDPGLLEIPIVHWKLLEIYEKRRKKMEWMNPNIVKNNPV